MVGAYKHASSLNNDLMGATAPTPRRAVRSGGERGDDPGRMKRGPDHPLAEGGEAGRRYQQPTYILLRRPASPPSPLRTARRGIKSLV